MTPASIIIFAVHSFLAVLMVLIMFGLLLYFVISCFIQRRRQSNKEITSNDSIKSISLSARHTISRENIIGRGRFGTVWKGLYNEETVAIKSFNSRHMYLFEREIGIYHTYLLKHNNILHFHFSEQLDHIGSMEYIAVFEYHSEGTLQDYLIAKEVSFMESIHLSVSLLNGLQFLHKTIVIGQLIKPGIAHRDIKSTNILVKSDGQLCIADLGMAVKQHNLESVDAIPENKLSGTKRYMSAEILTGSMDYRKFHSYVQSDMYSTSLVLWEIFNHSTVNGISQTYSLPYEDVVGRDPSIEEMRRCVFEENIRPKFPLHWDNNDEDLNTVTEVISECWDACAIERPPAIRVLRTLKSILDKESLQI